MSRGTSARRDHNHTYTHMPTRHDFSQMYFDEIHIGMKIRSLAYAKWIIDPIEKHDINKLPSVTRSQIAHGAEESMPKLLVIRHNRKPMWVLREL